jgi:hypothetical protein
MLKVSPATITFDLQYLSKEARETLSKYTTDELPLQLKTFMVATRNAIKQYWDRMQRITKKKFQAIEHYLDCHITLWTLLYGGEGYMMRYGNNMSQQQHEYTDDTFVV